MLLLYTLVLFTLQFTLMPLSKGNLIDVTAIAKPGCLSKCGEVTVPYPFGINTIAMANGSVTEHDCSLDATFQLTCNFTSKSPKLFFGSLKVISISLSDSEMRTSITIAFRCYDSYANVTDSHTSWTNIPEPYPFTFSEKNKLTVIGCDDYAWIRGPDGSDYASGCMGLCNDPSHVPNNGTCSGIGCCQTSIPPGLQYFNISLGSFDNHKNVVKSNRCGFAFLGDEKSFQFGGADDMSDANEFYNKTRSTVHRVLDWVIGMNQSCSEATVCKGNSFCRDADIGGYHCVCKEGYAGNPYLDLGCQGAIENGDSQRPRTNPSIAQEFEEDREKKKDVKEDKNQKKCTTAMAGNGVFASTCTHVYPIQEYNQEMQPMLDMLGFMNISVLGLISAVNFIITYIYKSHLFQFC